VSGGVGDSEETLLQLRRESLSGPPKTLGFELGESTKSKLKEEKKKMSQSGKLMPNLDQQSTKLLNLTVLQRIDPFVEEILITAAHVTFYEFNIDLSQWVRCPLSLCLSLAPEFFIFAFSDCFILFLSVFDSFEEPQGRRRISLRCQEVRFLI